jgi:hypothetical protein
MQVPVRYTGIGLVSVFCTGTGFGGIRKEVGFLEFLNRAPRGFLFN